MASNSHRKSERSASSKPRKQVHIGVGSSGRKGRVDIESHRAAIKDPAGDRAKGQRRARTAGGRAPDRRESAAARARREEREARKRERERQTRRRLLVIVGTVVAVAVLVVGVYRSALFTVTDVEIVGTSTLSVQSVLGQVDLPEDATLLRYPRTAIEAALAADPWIAEVSVTPRFPSTLVVEITEREARALVDTGFAFWYVDGEGRFLGEASLESTDTVIPVVRDVPGLEPVPGEVTGSESLANALAILGGITPELSEIVRAVSAASVNEATLVTGSSVEIMVGEATQLPEKSTLALSIMAEQGADVVFIDVRSIERPVSRGLGR